MATNSTDQEAAEVLRSVWLTAFEVPPDEVMNPEEYAEALALLTAAKQKWQREALDATCSDIADRLRVSEFVGMTPDRQTAEQVTIRARNIVYEYEREHSPPAQPGTLEKVIAIVRERRAIRRPT